MSEDKPNAEEIAKIFAEYNRLMGNNTDNTSSASIKVHAGGAAVWVAAWMASTCCAIMLGASFVGGFWISQEASSAAAERAELRSEIRDAKDYISATYQIAPELQKRLEELKKTKEDQQ